MLERIPSYLWGVIAEKSKKKVVLFILYILGFIIFSKQQSSNNKTHTTLLKKKKKRLTKARKGPNERAETRKTISPREIRRTKLKLFHRTDPSTEKQQYHY